MSTYTELTYQVVFCAKYRRKFLKEETQDELFNYFGGTLRGLDCHPIIIGGHVDHLHLVFSPSRKLSISTIVQKTKVATNKFIKQRPEDYNNFESWQIGYSAFSYKKRDRQMLINYVKKQKRHHEKKSFEEEYIDLLVEHNIDYKAEYLFS